MAITNILIYKFKAFPQFYNLLGYSNIARRFITLLLYTQRFAATDPRDKVFALSGLHLAGAALHDDDDWDPKAGYTTPWEVLYTNVTLRNLEKGWLNTLPIARKARQPRDWALPLWVPDYRRFNPETQVSMAELVSHYEWIAGGPCHSAGQGLHPNRPLMAKKHQLLTNQRRPIKQDLMSPELRRSKRGIKNILQTSISLAGLMMDEISYVGSTISSCEREGRRTEEIY